MCLLGYIAYGVHLCNKIYIFERKPDFRVTKIFKSAAQKSIEDDEHLVPPACPPSIGFIG